VVAGTLRESGVDPASVFLEITESVLMEDADIGQGHHFGRPMPAEAMARHLGLDPGAG
jgi:EAL domain-containing protein (putative c-di-GMP-specific phosphodiesterase class I)